MPNKYIDLPTGIHRVNRVPLDSSTVIENGFKGLYQYIATGTAYLGQRLLVRTNYGDNKFDIQVTLTQGNNNDGVMVPVFEFPTGYELISKVYTSNRYILIYYYNGGSVFTSRDQAFRINDAFAFSMLPHASLLANSDSEIGYMLEVNDDIYTFTQANFVTNDVALGSDSAINRISSTANGNFYCATPDTSIGIMPRTVSDKIIRLWVRANEYCKAIGVI